MKIILINPPARQLRYQSIVVPPLGLLYVGVYLKNAGFDVNVKDAFAEGMDWGNFTNYIRIEKPDVIGIGGMSPVIDTTFKAIKTARPYAKYIIMGGPHISIYKQKIFDQCPEIDFGVIGEGEETSLELMKALKCGDSVAGIKGVITSTIQNEDREWIDNIDFLFHPDRSLLHNHLYRYPFFKHRHVTTMMTSRGCPYSCTFCDKSTFGSTWRARSVENVLSEIDEIVNGCKIKSIIFYDDLFTLKKDRVVGICEGILSRGYKFDWKCEGRVNLADLEVMKLMKRAGCTMIAYGVESGNQIGLDYLNKNTSVGQARQAIELTRKAGIKTMSYFILGIPTETFEDELKTVEFAKAIKTTFAQFSVLSPYYGTKVYEDSIQKGWYREVDAQNPLDKDFKRPVIISDNWDEEKLQKILKVAYRKFYLRPMYIAKLIFSIGSIRQVINYFKELLNIISWMRK